MLSRFLFQAKSQVVLPRISVSNLRFFSNGDDANKKRKGRKRRVLVEKPTSDIKQNPQKKATQLPRDNPTVHIHQNYSYLASIPVPKEYPQLMGIPLTRRPLFPGFYKSLYLKDPQAIAAIQSLLDKRQPYIGVFLGKSDESDADIITDINQVYSTGVFAQITNVYQAGPDNNSLTVVVYPHRRIKIKSLLNQVSSPQAAEEKVISTDARPTEEKVISTDASYAESLKQSETKMNDDIMPINEHLTEFKVGLVNVEHLKEEPYKKDDPYIKAVTSEILNVLKEISHINPLLRDQIIQFSIQTGGSAFQDPAKLADFAAAVCQGNPSELQSVIESLKLEDRLHKALIVLKKELDNAKLQTKIAKDVDKRMNRKHQEYFLMEQLRGIKKELGIDNDSGKDKLVETFKQKSIELNMPDEVRKVFDEELRKLQSLEANAAEYNVTRNYLDWITSLPWGNVSKENYNIKQASTVLDEDHYGLKDVKERILEFIAIGKLSKNLAGKIICFVGPPGVGKTSIGKSIARALGREFFRFSVGGLSDVAEIKGHRRTYVGAMPGKIIQALKKVKTENPLIMIDEIDKLSKGHQGDPASALLELLDPEQNNSFLDHYMDVPVDLSKVLFVSTANVTETIPGPLLDRMEVIRLSGYVEQEKLAIAEKYLVPASIKSAGIKYSQIQLSSDAIVDLIRYWCRESGVRTLKKQIDKIFRKVALQIVQKEQDEAAKEGIEKVMEHVIGSASNPIEVNVSNLKDYVGTQIYQSERLYDVTPPGVVMGLAWTSLGGSPLYMESVLESSITEKSKPGLSRTGQLGDVMKESVQIAYTFAKSLMTRKFPDNKFFDKAQIHLHVPEGATPKDGPSAGCTMATSLISLALKKPVPSHIAMTGELTLTGKILKIGGVKEKTIAAKRSGITIIIFPRSNEAEWNELADYIKEGITPVFVDWYDEIFNLVFQPVDLSTNLVKEQSINV